MTFQEFQTLCQSAVISGQPVKSACPIIIGDPAAPIRGSYGEFNRVLVEFRETPDNAALKPIVQSVRFSYDAANNETVITPVTTGVGA
jgi:hypothetical protein